MVNLKKKRVRLRVLAFMIDYLSKHKYWSVKHLRGHFYAENIGMFNNKNHNKLLRQIGYIFIGYSSLLSRVYPERKRCSKFTYITDDRTIKILSDILAGRKLTCMSEIMRLRDKMDWEKAIEDKATKDHLFFLSQDRNIDPHFCELYKEVFKA